MKSEQSPTRGYRTSHRSWSRQKHSSKPFQDLQTSGATQLSKISRIHSQTVPCRTRHKPELWKTLKQSNWCKKVKSAQRFSWSSGRNGYIESPGKTSTPRYPPGIQMIKYSRPRCSAEKSTRSSIRRYLFPFTGIFLKNSQNSNYLSVKKWASG